MRLKQVFGGRSFLFYDQEDSMEEQQGENRGRKMVASKKIILLKMLHYDFIREFQELGYPVDESEIHSWLLSDANDPGFQLMTGAEICEFVATQVWLRKTWRKK
jgi:hypothetical protein